MYVIMCKFKICSCTALKLEKHTMCMLLMFLNSNASLKSWDPRKMYQQQYNELARYLYNLIRDRIFWHHFIPNINGRSKYETHGFFKRFVSYSVVDCGVL